MTKQLTKPQAPPPPSASPRYLLAVPTSITSLRDLGIQLSPFHESSANSSRSIGAKVTYLHDNKNLTYVTSQNGANDNDESTKDILRSWIQQYNLKVGDVIYKINNDVVKTRTFDSIIDRLNTLFVCNSVNGGQDCDGVISLIMERRDDDEQKNKSKDTSVGKASMESNSGLLSNEDECGMSVSIELSREHNVLHSIFAKNHTQPNNSFNHQDTTNENIYEEKSREIDEYTKNISNDDHSSLNELLGHSLIAIPEEVENDISGEHEHKKARPRPQSQCLTKAQRDHHTISSSLCQSEEQNNMSNDHSLSCIGSPTFSYSDSECLGSPTTRSRLSLDSENKGKLQIPTFLVNNGNSSSSKNSIIGGLSRQHQKPQNNFRSVYMSPESENTSSVDFSSKSLCLGHKVVQFSSDIMKESQVQDKDRNQIKMKALAFQSPISEILPSSSVESCSLSTVYLSPLSNILDENVARNSPASIDMISKQHTNSSSYHGVPMHMLDLNFVRECRSLRVLTQIIQCLETSQTEESQKYPHVLNAAKLQLVSIKRSHAKLSDECQEQRRKLNDIPTHIHVEIQTNSKDNIRSMTSHKKHLAMDDDECNSNIVENNYDLIENMNSMVIAHAEIQNQMDEILQERDDLREKMAVEIKKWERKVNKLSNQMRQDKDESTQKIEALSHSKSIAEERVQVLQGRLVSSSKEAKVVMEELKSCKDEIERLKVVLCAEKDSKTHEVGHTSKLHLQLQERITHLKRQVDLHEEEDNVSRALIEIKLRSEYEVISENDKTRIKELERSLAETRGELQRLNDENQVMKINVSEFEKKQTCSSQYCEIMKEFAAAEACANALAKALTESESDLYSITMENNILKKKNRKLLKKHNAIEMRNKDLIRSLESLNKELMTRDTIITNLRQELDQYKAKEDEFVILKMKWDGARALYQSKMAEVKKLIAASHGKGIPEKEYNEAIESAKHLRLSLKIKDEEIDALRRQISQLETTSEESNYVAKSMTPKGINNDSDSSHESITKGYLKESTPTEGANSVNFYKKNMNEREKKLRSQLKTRKVLGPLEVNRVGLA